MSSTVRTTDLSSRFSLFPIVDEEAYKFFKLQEARIWSSNELSFEEDRKDYRSLSKKKQRILDIILCFFLPGDGLINNNLIHRFMVDSKVPEEVTFYTAQAFIESIHAETYGLIVVSIYTPEEIRKLQQITDDSEYFRLKTDYIEKWTHSKKSWPERLLAMACAEGIFFSVLFLFIFWFRSMGKFNNLIHANELIACDETLHRDFGCNRFKHYGGLPQDEAMKIVKEAVDIEKKFVSWMLREIVDELNEEDMNQFVGLVADNLLVEAGLEPYYKTSNPFPWVDDLSMVKRTNFFERKGGNYTISSIGDALNWRKRAGLSSSDDVEDNQESDAFDVDF